MGISWKTAPAEIRDQCLLPPEKAELLLERLRERGIVEGLVLSTCNRIEVWTASDDPVATAAVCRATWFEVCQPDALFHDRTYEHVHQAAVEHIYRVAASVDSLVLGETQIPSQVRLAWEWSRDRGCAGFFLSRLVQGALAASKRVKSTTRLGEGALSISSAAVDLARKIAGDLERLSIAIVGAGEMAELALTGFVRAKASRFSYLNRTPENARKFLAVHPGRLEGLDALERAVAESDVVVSATGAPGFVIDADLVKRAMKGRRKPLFLLDIAAPRDIDPAAGSVPGVFLYGIDDLEQVVDKNRRQRSEEASRAESLLLEETDKFRSWWRGLAVVPVLARVRERVHATARDEVDRFLPRLRRPLDDAELREVLEDFAQALANKFLHGPTVAARKGAAEGREPETAAALRELFLSGGDPWT